MMKHNANNERIKRQYFIFLKEAKRQNEASVDAVAKAISRFESYTKYKDFKAFDFEQAVGFKNHLAKQTNQQTGKPLSKATLNSTLRQLKTFFSGWLCSQVINLKLIIPIRNTLIYLIKKFVLQRRVEKRLSQHWNK